MTTRFLEQIAATYVVNQSQLPIPRNTYDTVWVDTIISRDNNVIAMSQMSDSRRCLKQSWTTLNHGPTVQAVIAIELNQSKLIDAFDDQIQLGHFVIFDFGHEFQGFGHVFVDEGDQ